MEKRLLNIAYYVCPRSMLKASRLPFYPRAHMHGECKVPGVVVGKRKGIIPAPLVKVRRMLVGNWKNTVKILV